MKLPPYNTFPEIVAPGMLLRQILEADIKDMVEISRYNGKPALTEEEAADMQSSINNDYQQGSSIHWGIMDTETHIVVGTCGYYRGLSQGVGEIGCILKPAFRGQGYMTTAIKLAVHFGIHTIGLTKIIAITTKNNDHAIKLLNRLHFIKTVDLNNDKVKYQFDNSAL